MKKKKQPSFRHYHPHLYRFGKWTGRLVALLTMLSIVVGLIGVIYVRGALNTTPQVTEEALRSDPSSNMYAANGDLVWSSAKNRRVYVNRKDIPDTYVNMLLATEQKTFFEDTGFSPKGLANAFKTAFESKVLNKGEIRGGSSLEQQLIKLTVFSTSEADRNVSRKVQEFYLANQLYENYSKDEILEYYVNKLPLSENSFGAQTLAKTYFNKSMTDLSIAQTALIVGSGQAPSAYNVYDNPKDAKERRDTILYIAHEDKIISDDEYKTALEEPVDKDLMERYWQTTETNKTIVQHDAYVQRTLDELADMGYQLDETPLQIYTALDVDLNTHLKNIYDTKKEYFQDNQQSAATLIENDTGHVLAQIGGRNVTEVDSYNRASQKVRSSGSSTKTFFYAAGMDKYGWGTNKPFDGSNYKYAGTNLWASNYGGEQVGATTLQESLRNSYNTVMLRAFDEVGPKDEKIMLNKLGMNVKEDLTTGKALGFESSTEEIAGAYSVLANGGILKDPTFVKKIVFPDKSEKEIKPVETRVMQESTAWMLLHVLKGTKYMNPESKNNVVIKDLPQAVKTGTVGYPRGSATPSGTAMDLWTAGTSPKISLAIWHGFDKPMENNGWMIESYMAQRKFDLYKDIMSSATKDRDNKDWPKPESVIHVSGKGTGAHYRPAKVDNSYLKGEATSKSITEDAMKYFKSSEKDSSVKRGDNEYEVSPDNYEYGGWKPEVEKRAKEVDEKILELQTKEDAIRAEWVSEQAELEKQRQQAADEYSGVKEQQLQEP